MQINTTNVLSLFGLTSKGNAQKLANALDDFLFQTAGTKAQSGYDLMDYINGTTVDVSTTSAPRLKDDPVALDAALNEAVATGVITSEDVENIKNIADDKIKLCAKGMTPEKYAYVNNLLFGEQKDAGLAAQINTISAKYGVNIMFDNDLVTTDYAKASGVVTKKMITKERVQAIDDALAQMIKMGRSLPPQIYLTECAKGCAGVYCPRTPDAITINIMTSAPTETFKGTIYHEAAHMMDDFNLTEGLMLSNIDPSINFNADVEEIGNENSGFANKSDVYKFISYYAVTKNAEFVAETARLITNETIIVGKDGKYTINPQKLVKNLATGEMGYRNAKNKFVPWDGSKEDLNSLRKIVGLYNYMTQNEIVNPRDYDSSFFLVDSTKNSNKIGNKETGTVSKAAVKNFIGEAALQNNASFARRMEYLIQDGMITKNKNGSYTINPKKLMRNSNGEMYYINTDGNKTFWKGTKKQVKKISNAMNIYNEIKGDDAKVPKKTPKTSNTSNTSGKSNKSGKTGNANKSAKSDKAAKSDSAGKSDKSGSAGKSADAGKSGKSGKAGKSSGKSGNSDKAGKSSKTGNADKSAKSDKAGKSGKSSGKKKK